MDTAKKDSKEIFEQYSKEYLKYNEAIEKEQTKQQELAELENQYKFFSDQENELERERQELMQVERVKLQEVEKQLEEEMQKKLEETQKEYDYAVKKIIEKKDSRSAMNKKHLSDGMEKFREQGCTLVKQSLSNLNQNLYEFAAKKEEFLDAKVKKENEIEDLRNEINLDIDKELTILQRKQNDIYKKYEPIIEEKTIIVQDIEEKHFPAIQIVDEKIRGIEEKYEEIISGINHQRSQEVELFVIDKNVLEKQYKETDKRFKKQINFATLRKEPVAQLKVQHNAAIQNIQASITKIDSDINKLNFKYDKQINDAKGKQQKELNVSFGEKGKLVEAKNEELSKPKAELEKITGERNLELNNLEAQKQELEQQREGKLIELENILKAFLLEIDENLKNLKAELIAFGTENGLGVEEKSSEVYEPFEDMKKNLSIWMNGLVRFIPETNKRDSQIDSWKNFLEDMSYEELFTIKQESDNYIKSVPFYLQNLKDKMVIAISISILLGTILAFLVKVNTVVAYGIPILLSGLYYFVATKKKRELGNKYCEFIFLANNYRGLHQINSRVQMLTDNATYEKVNEIADNIYGNVSGPELLQKKFKEEEFDINKDYTNESELAKEQYEQRKEIVVSESRKRVLELRRDYANKKQIQSKKLETINSKINDAKREKNRLSKNKEQVSNDLKSYEDVLKSFDKIHSQFKKNLLHMSASVEITEGILRDDIYLIPTDYEQCSDSNGHLPFIHIIHEKHPILVTLDTQDIPKDGTFQEKLGDLVKNCLLDFALAFKNINGKEIIKQYIIDEISGGHQLRSDNYTNLLEIEEVTESIQDMKLYFDNFKTRRDWLSKKGTTLRKYNMKQIEEGERPGVYNICYMVLKSEGCLGFREHVSSLMKNGWDYGFVPIFICEKEMWESNKDKTDTVLNEISMNVTTIIKFNGKKYEELDNE